MMEVEYVADPVDRKGGKPEPAHLHRTLECGHEVVVRIDRTAVQDTGHQCPKGSVRIRATPIVQWKVEVEHLR